MAKKIIQDPKRETVSFSLDLKNGKLAVYKLHVPNFDEIHFALIEMTTLSGKLDMVAAGKVIFNLCCYEYDEILDTPGLVGAKMSLLLNLAKEYVSDISYEIKKN